MTSVKLTATLLQKPHKRTHSTRLPIQL